MNYQISTLLATMALILFNCGQSKPTASNPSAAGNNTQSQIGLIGQINISEFVGFALKNSIQPDNGPFLGYQTPIYGIKKDGSYEELSIPTLPSLISEACQTSKFIFLERFNSSFNEPYSYVVMKSNGKVYALDRSVSYICRQISAEDSSSTILDSGDVIASVPSGGDQMVTLDASSGEPVVTTAGYDPRIFNYARNPSGDVIYSSSMVTYGDGRVQSAAINIRESNGKMHTLETIGGGKPSPYCFFSGAGEGKNNFYYVFDNSFYIVRKSGDTFTKIKSSATPLPDYGCPNLYRTSQSIFTTTNAYSGGALKVFKLTTPANSDLSIAQYEIADIVSVRKIVGTDEEIYLVSVKQDGDGIVRLELEDGKVTTLLNPVSGGQLKFIKDFDVLPGKWLSFLHAEGTGKNAAQKLIPEANGSLIDSDQLLPGIGKLILWNLPGCKSGYGRKNYVCSPFICEAKKSESISCLMEKSNSTSATKTRTCSDDRFSYTYSTCLVQQCSPGYSLLSQTNECAANMCEPSADLGVVSCVDDKPNSTAATKSKSCSADGQTYVFGTCSVTSCANGFSSVANNCASNVTAVLSKFALYKRDTVDFVTTDTPVVGQLTVNAGSSTRIAIGRGIEYIYGTTTYIVGGYIDPSTGLPGIIGSHADYTWSVTGGSLNRTGLYDGYSYNYVAPAVPGLYKLTVVLVTNWTAGSTNITNAVREAFGSRFTQEYEINVQ